MRAITDSTCDYGLAFTGDGCVRTLSSYDLDAYFHVQIVYFVLGSITMIASAIMYFRSVKYEASKLQQYNFLFCCYASLTILSSGFDPKSYGHVIPRPITSFLSDSLTAALYSVYILTLGYWVAIIRSGAAMSGKPPYLACLEGIAISIVWSFYIIYNGTLFLSKGFNRAGITYLHLMWSAIMLTIISTVFLTYGLRVLSRLLAYERDSKLRESTTMSDRVINHSYDMEGMSEEDSRTTKRLEPKKGHSAKIRKILLVTEMLSLTVVAAQIFMAVSHTAKESEELRCANGIGCESITAGISYLNILQVTCVWVVLWIFRTIKKKEVIPHPRTHALV